MILTDDNFGTLVNAVEIGRRVYDKVVSYVRYQMTQLLSLVMLFVAASAFDVNQGVALTPLMVLYLLFFATAAGVVIIAIDPGDPDVMHRPPRDPAVPITNRTAITLWIVYAAVLFVGAFIPLVLGPTTRARIISSASLTMTFVVMGLGTVFNAITNRRDPTSGLTPPILKALAVSLVPLTMIVLATELPGPAEGPLHAVADRARVGRVPRARADAPDRDRGRQVDPPPARTRGVRRCRPVAHRGARPGSDGGCVVSSDAAAPSKMKRKEYEHELRRLHGELVAMQEWVKATGAKICIVFEGRDTAGKGGTIKAITERVSPRVFRVVALPAPTEREKSQMYVQRYLPHLPAAGEVVIFDRSWYNRAGVERVMGFCTEEQADALPRAGPGRRARHGRLRDHPDQVLARGEPGGADAAAPEPDRRPAQDLEALRTWT